MATFNLKKYMEKVKEIDKHTDVRLREKGSVKEIPTTITENQLEDSRKGAGNESYEAKLEKVRTQAATQITEAQLNNSKSKLVKHRNESAYRGDISKLEEKRQAGYENRADGDAWEFEDYEIVSEVDKPRRYYETPAGEDGLKLAKTAQRSVYDDDVIDYDQRRDWVPLEILEDDTDDTLEEFSPEVQKMLDEINDDFDIEDLPDEMLKDLAHDSDVIHDMFEDVSINTSDETGTMIEQRAVKFDIDSPSFTELFADKNGIINEHELKKAVLTFIKSEHPDFDISYDMLVMDRMNDGIATYMRPLNHPYHKGRGF